MPDFSRDELLALQARLVRPLADADVDEPGLSVEVKAYRIQENHYRSAVAKIEHAIAGPPRLDDLPLRIRELVEAGVISLYYATMTYRRYNHNQHETFAALTQAARLYKGH
jgi:hypothetical protein